jgi:hypothetical protein
VTPAERRSEVERHIKEMVKEGVEPTGRGVMRRMGLGDDRTIRKIWDSLSVEGRAPARPRSDRATEREYGFRPGRALLDIEQDILRFQREFAVASDEHRRLGEKFWLRHLTEAERLLSEAWGMVTGSDLENVLEGMQEKNE